MPPLTAATAAAPAGRYRLSAILAAVTTATGVIGTMAADPRTADLAHANWRTAAGFTSALLTGAGIAWQAYNKSVDRARDSAHLPPDPAADEAPTPYAPTPEDRRAWAAADRVNAAAAAANATAPAGPAAPAIAVPPATVGGVLGQLVQEHVDASPPHIIAGVLGGLLSVVFPPAAGAIGAVERGVEALGRAERTNAAMTITPSDADASVPRFDPTRVLTPAAAAAATATPGPIAPASNPAGYAVDAAGKVTI